MNHQEQPPSEWLQATNAWTQFTLRHPELGYSPGRMAFYNFMRYHREALVAAGALRRAKRRFWIAHKEWFPLAAFECATGQTPAKMDESGSHQLQPPGGVECGSSPVGERGV